MTRTRLAIIIAFLCILRAVEAIKAEIERPDIRPVLQFQCAYPPLRSVYSVQHLK